MENMQIRAQFQCERESIVLVAKLGLLANANSRLSLNWPHFALFKNAIRSRLDFRKPLFTAFVHLLQHQRQSLASTKMQTTFFLLVLALTAFLAVDAACYNDKCKFRFCNDEATFYLPAKPAISFTDRICSRDGPVIGHIDSTGEALVVLSKGYVPISKWYPAGLKQYFSPSFFKSLNVRVDGDGYKPAFDFSGVGHENTQQNQADFLKGQCFFLPLTAYQVLDEARNVVDNKHPRNPTVDCVAFGTE